MAKNEDLMPQANDLMPPVERGPITDQQRLIVQNLFDTQPEKRKAYMKQLGYELDPKDDNKYRPIGTTSGYAEIDPGIGAYFKPGGLKEVARDMGDIAWDTVISGPLTAMGSAKGASLGAKAPGFAKLILGVTGAVLGGSIGNATSEAFKSAAGEIALDDNIPQDMKLTAIQSLISGGMPQVVKGLAKGGKMAVREILDSRAKAISNAAAASGGGLTPEIIEKAAKNPEQFSKEAVQGATEKLTGIYKEIFGTTVEKPKSTRQISGGIFKEKANELNKQADAELTRLAANPQADFTIGELSDPIKAQIKKLADKFSLTSEESNALSYLRSKLNELETKGVAAHDAKYGAQSLTPMDQKRIDFRQGREFLKSMQDDAFDKEIPGSSIVRQAVGGDKNAIRGIADAKAAQLGSPLPEINAQRSKLLTTYKNAQEALTPANMTSAFVGDDNVKKQLVQEASKEMDAVLGTQYSTAIEDGQVKRLVENMYNNPKAFGSGRVVAEAVSGGAKGMAAGGVTGAGVGAMTGVGAIPGAIVGGIGGAVAGAERATAMSTPEKALAAIAKNKSSVESLTNQIDMPWTQTASQMPGAVESAIVGNIPQPSGSVKDQDLMP